MLPALPDYRSILLLTLHTLQAVIAHRQEWHIFQAQAEVYTYFCLEFLLNCLKIGFFQTSLPGYKCLLQTMAMECRCGRSHSDTHHNDLHLITCSPYMGRHIFCRHYRTMGRRLVVSFCGQSASYMFHRTSPNMDWTPLNRFRTGHACLHECGLVTSDLCECGCQ